MLKALLEASVSLIPWCLRGTIGRLPVIAPLQRWIILQFLSGHEFVHLVNAGPAKGMRYLVRMPEDKLIWTGTWELQLATALAAAVRPGDVCYDIGGYHGFFAGVFAQAGAGAIEVFEPLPANCVRIRRLMEFNPAMPIHLNEIAVGETPGLADFRVMPEATMGKLSTSTFQTDASSVETIPVKVCRIDNLMAAYKMQPPAVMKIDVEGVEAAVLRGAVETLRRYRPRLFVEIHGLDSMRECVPLLTSLGYALMVLETGREPYSGAGPEVCHLIGRPQVSPGSKER